MNKCHIWHEKSANYEGIILLCDEFDIKSNLLKIDAARNNIERIWAGAMFFLKR
jgi:hypothetical protein